MRHLDAIMVSISTTCTREKFASDFHRNVQRHMPLLGFNRHPYRCNLLNDGDLIKDLPALQTAWFSHVICLGKKLETKCHKMEMIQKSQREK